MTTPREFLPQINIRAKQRIVFSINLCFLQLTWATKGSSISSKGLLFEFYTTTVLQLKFMFYIKDKKNT